MKFSSLDNLFIKINVNIRHVIKFKLKVFNIQGDPIIFFKCSSNFISCPISISDISNEKAFKGL
jgi:hypothetical protein